MISYGMEYYEKLGNNLSNPQSSIIIYFVVIDKKIVVEYIGFVLEFVMYRMEFINNNGRNTCVFLICDGVSTQHGGLLSYLFYITLITENILKTIATI